jgi:hypothetical protein
VTLLMEAARGFGFWRRRVMESFPGAR